METKNKKQKKNEIWAFFLFYFFPPYLEETSPLRPAMKTKLKLFVDARIFIFSNFYDHVFLTISNKKHKWNPYFSIYIYIYICAIYYFSDAPGPTCNYYVNTNSMYILARSAGAVEYTDCISTKG